MPSKKVLERREIKKMVAILGKAIPCETHGCHYLEPDAGECTEGPACDNPTCRWRHLATAFFCTKAALATENGR